MHARILKNLFVAIFLLTSNLIFAQVGINNTTPDASAELDIKSSARGFLAPRMTGTQMNTIASPATGLTVYNTDSSAYCVYTGSAWIKMLTQTNSFLNKSGSDIYTNNSGNVGIGTSSPLSKLHIKDGNFLVSGNYTVGNSIEATGAGTRMFFNPAKGTFRAGGVSGSQWNNSNIGFYSFAVGEDNTANAAYAISGGYTNTASGQSSIALGYVNTASGNQSVALGRLNTAGSYGETVIGLHATTYAVNSTGQFNTSDRLFNIGNGTSSTSRSDAFTVLKSGNTGIGNATPNSTLEVNGALAVKVKTAQVAGTNNPDGTGEVWFYSSGTGTITLPAASTCANRMYTIINQTGASRTISTYRDLAATSQTTLANGSSIFIISDGTNWLQFR